MNNETRHPFRLTNLCLAFALCTAAHAAPIDITYTGVVASIDNISAFTPTFLSTALVGDAVTLSFRFESTTPDAHANPSLGDYSAGLIGFSINIGTHGFSTNFPETRTLTVADGPTQDILTTEMTYRVALLPAGSFFRIAASLTDNDASAFTGDAIPSSLNFSDFESALGSLSFWDGGTTQTGEITFDWSDASIDPFFIPLPTIPGLTAVAFAALAAPRSRRAR
ncbi:MAG: hypothetical protein AB7G17_11525 [Phycisphaerales bacterium]